MVSCPKCGKAMISTMHFSKEKHYKNKICKNCHYETRPNRIKFDSLFAKTETR